MPPRRSTRAKKESHDPVKVEVVKSSSSAMKKPSVQRNANKKLLKKTAKKKLKKPFSRVRPTIDESRYATSSLSKLHPDVVDRNDTRRKTMLEACGMRDSITDSIISTMLSQNTTDANSKAAWFKLKKKFPDWDIVESCDVTLIEDAIRVAGLAKTRAQRIQDMLRLVKQERGHANLDYIRDLNDEEVKRELSRFKGLGPKTISCVLLFALGRDEFPVDTHVLRISQKVGWVPSGTSREDAYEYLNEMIPNDVKMDLHCLLVHHGKVCHRCAANGRPQFPPKDGTKLQCPLVNVSSWAGSVPMDTQKQNIHVNESKTALCVKAVPIKVKSEEKFSMPLIRVKKEEDAAKIKMKSEADV